MLKLVESLATKAERAKHTTVAFTPLPDCVIGTYKCAWCESVVKGKRQGWSGFEALGEPKAPGPVRVSGIVCSRRECRVSLQAKYTKLNGT
jgi:hypothetical protein